MSMQRTDRTAPENRTQTKNADFQTLYFRCFNAMTDAIHALEHGCAAAAMAQLKHTQMETEDVYISVGDDTR